MLREFDPAAAYLLAFQYFWLHIVVVLALSGIFTALSWLKNQPPSGSRWSWIAAKLMSLIAFSSLGLTAAFLLSRGINVDTKDQQNPVITSVATALITLITGAIAYLEGSAATGRQGQQPRSGIAVFLLTCVVSYQAFVYQDAYIY